MGGGHGIAGICSGHGFGFDALVLPGGMLKACRWIWTRFYMG